MLAETKSDPPLRAAWTAFMDGNRVGHAQLVFVDDRRSGRLARVAMAPEWRGRGLGEKLVGSVLDLAFGLLAMREVQLRVMAGNTAARQLYRKLGFRLAEGTTSNWAPEAFIAMALTRP